MKRRRVDIAFDRDGSSRFLPWLIALMVFLAALATSGGLALQHALESWNQGLSDTLTLEIPPPPIDQPQADGGLSAALDILKATPGVLSAMPLDRSEAMKLIEPWLGPGLAPNELPLPRLVDIRVDTTRKIDFGGLKKRLAAAAPGSLLDDHRLWLDRLIELALSVEATALAIVLVIGGSAVLTVVFTTKAGLSVHRDVIELLHLMGARDSYIAAQFQRQALRLGLSGGLIGLALAVVTVLGLRHAADTTVFVGDDFAFLPALQLDPANWAELLLLPLAAALIAMMTARITVLRALARMP